MAGLHGELKTINERLKTLILRHVPVPGKLPTAIPGLTLSRRQAINKADACLGTPGVAAIIQGAKCCRIGDEEHIYREGQFSLTGIDLPSAFHILDPSETRPFLAVILDLDSRLIARLSATMPPLTPSGRAAQARGVCVGDLDADLLGCFLRLVELLDRPEQVRVRAPMIIEELHYLLLSGPCGASLLQLNTHGTEGSRVVRAVARLRASYRQPLCVEELAHEACMSISTFNRQFRAVTGLSPLQFHKQLRLFEAQRLMVHEGQTAASAAWLVGYDSDTQFHREYRRLFGAPPRHDADEIRSMLAI